MFGVCMCIHAMYVRAPRARCGCGGEQHVIDVIAKRAGCVPWITNAVWFGAQRCTGLQVCWKEHTTRIALRSNSSSDCLKPFRVLTANLRQRQSGNLLGSGERERESEGKRERPGMVVGEEGCMSHAQNT